MELSLAGGAHERQDVALLLSQSGLHGEHSSDEFFEARETEPSVTTALEAIQTVYRVEHDAKEAGISQTAEHLVLRQQRAGPAMAKLLTWLNSATPELR